jgi:hypothetical protein
MGTLGEDEGCGCTFSNLKRYKLKLMYRARKSTIWNGFFCDVVERLQLFLFSFVYFLCDIAYAMRYWLIS